ncbi:MAG: Mechanosensitive channel MscK [Chlamydiae bacterium]|nr:Mechanosensitive channel MscK [Chlamydiota bacterium]
MRFSNIFLLLLLILPCTLGYSQNKVDRVLLKPAEAPALSTLPNPLELHEDWWEYFNVDVSELPNRIDTFTDSLKVIVKESSEEGKEKIAPLVTKIESNLYAYLLAKTQPLEEAHPVTTIQESYHVDEIVKLNRDIRNREIIFRADEEDFDERKNQISSGLDRLRTLKANYDNAEPRSEQKLIDGLKLINFQISLKLAEVKQHRLTRAIEIDRQVIDWERKELESARRNVVSDRDELKQKQLELDQAQSRWNQKSELLREQEASSITSFDFSQRGELAKLTNQLLDQKLSRAAIEEALALNVTILRNIELEWVQYLNFPDEKEFKDLDEKAQQWDEDIAVLKQKLREWQLSITRDIQRAQEWLSLNVDVDDDDSQAIRDLQEKILQESEQSLVLVIQLSNDIQDSEFLLGLVNKAIATRKGGFDKFIVDVWDTVVSFTKTTTTWITQPLFRLGKTVIDAWAVIKFFVVILVSIWIARALRAAIKRFAIKRQGVKLSLLYRVNRLFQYLVIVIGVIIALTVIGFDFSNLVLIAGALGVGLGFGLQSLFNNFVSGIVILFENQLKVGDYIELESGLIGEIKEINVRSTYIKTNNGIAVMVPNSELTTGRVINWTHKEPFRRVQIFFSVAYDSDKELVKKVVREAVLNVPITLKKSWVPEPRVFIESMGPNSLEFKVSVWVDDAATKRSSYTQSMYLWAIHDALTENKIRIPYPQLDLHIESVLEKRTFDELIKDFKQNKPKE